MNSPFQGMPLYYTIPSVCLDGIFIAFLEEIMFFTGILETYKNVVVKVVAFISYRTGGIGQNLSSKRVLIAREAAAAEPNTLAIILYPA